MSSQRKTRTFEKRMSEVLGIRPNEVESVFRGARPTSIRVNRLLEDDRYRETVEFVRDKAPGLIPVDWCEHTYFWPDNDGFDDILPLAHEGRVYLQNAASLIPPVALDAQPGDSVLDIASAPGGKAFHIAARVGNDCELWLNDSAPPRARKLAELAELYGVRYAELTTHNAQYIDKSVPAERFDRILLDVQCSGEGRVNLRKSDALKFWSEERIEKYKFLQAKMCDAAYKLLKPGGVLVYSTCTLSPEEDEFPVNKVLQRHSDLTVEPLGFSEEEFLPGLNSWRGTKFDKRLKHAVRVMPSDVFEGFFVAKVAKAPATA
ncbi:RsmB/NOP family class I SAM-dependent RNA methyltransferase [Saccharopolyspora gloriosae]|uniref:RsmB/NOP family class I SAM-dependent RNA methyltransferase n=1 Tax=Saccharopolyspora gloriosae TaxID=455344 RepID=UPI001FB74DAE|nr:RsmB/NOP family class I SAM-dependent RNA methyltransferase [Saccharopolyspora gloriosae]